MKNISKLLVRIMVGAVFISEGIQKFLMPDLRGSGRFATIGLPQPEVLGTLIGGLEVVCGALILLGFLSRIGAITTMVIMLGALISTKVPIFVSDGFWQALHAARTDWAMLIGSILIALNGSGSWAISKFVPTKFD